MILYWITAGVAALLWTMSLLNPALATCDAPGSIRRWWAGIEILGQGWMGLPAGTIASYARHPFLDRARLSGFGRVYLSLTIGATLLAASSFARVRLFDGAACERGLGRVSRVE